MIHLMAFLFTLGSAHASPLPSSDLSLAVIPRETVVDQGPFKTCANIVNKEMASAYGPGLYFPRVVLDWRDPSNELMVTSIRAVVKGSGIYHGAQTISVPYSEASLLFGNGFIPPNHYVDSAKNEPSSNPRAHVRQLPPCGLVLQNLNFDTTGTPFTIDIEIQFYGVAVSSDYSIQLSVMTSAFASAEYIP